MLEHKVTQVAAIGGREVLYLVPEADEWVVLNVFTYEVKRGSWKYITPKVTQVKLVSLPSSRTLVIWETDHEISKTSFVQYPVGTNFTTKWSVEESIGNSNMVSLNDSSRVAIYQRGNCGNELAWKVYDLGATTVAENRVSANFTKGWTSLFSIIELQQDRYLLSIEAERGETLFMVYGASDKLLRQLKVPLASSIFQVVRAENWLYAFGLDSSLHVRSVLEEDVEVCRGKHKISREDILQVNALYTDQVYSFRVTRQGNSGVYVEIYSLGKVLRLNMAVIYVQMLKELSKMDHGMLQAVIDSFASEHLQ